MMAPWIQLVVLFLCMEALVFQGIAREDYLVPPANLKSAPYPEWAHHHWVWLEVCNQSTIIQLATDYLDHGIEVGAVDIEPTWSTGMINFVFDTSKFPNVTEMVEVFHSKGVRVIMWAASMVNTDSPNYQEAYNKNYFIRSPLDEQHVFSWWLGKGSLLDFTNEEAKEWWHAQMDETLAYGIDGWKCDAAEPYMLELILPCRGKQGMVTRREYSEAYYADFFDYTRQKLGNESLIMSRPVDGFGPFYLDFSPRRVMFSGWIGDNDPTFKGMEDALRKYLQSAWAGYANFGSDIGGYRRGSGKYGRTKELFIRWSQLGAFSPLMENGGYGEHRPWMYDNQTLEIYKKFVDTHYQLVPYFLTTGSEALETNTSSITPLAKHENFINKLIDIFKPSTFNYLLGKNILVAPVHTNSSSVSVTFPEGSSWVDWWNHSNMFTAGSTQSFTNIPLEGYPVFFRNGSFLPLRVTEKTSVLGGGGFAGYLRWLLHSPAETETPVSSVVREQKGGGIVASYMWPKPNCMMVSISAHYQLQSLIEIAGLQAAPQSVAVQNLDGSMMYMEEVLSISELRKQEHGYYKTELHHRVIILPNASGRYGHIVYLYF